LGTLAFPAYGGLVVETRFEGRVGTASLKPGDVLNFGLYVTVTGNDANPNNDGLSNLRGSLVSRNVNGGVLHGDLTATPIAPFNANGAYGGNARDIDGDGDLDAGGYIPDGGPDTGTGYFIVRAGSWQFLSDNRTEFKVADLRLNVNSVIQSPQAGAATIIEYEPSPQYYGDFWQSDGQTITLYEKLLTLDDVQVAAWGATQTTLTNLDAPPGVFAQQIAIVPEPSSIYLAALTVSAWLAVPRRRLRI
jgi:hypothetical protein